MDQSHRSFASASGVSQPDSLNDIGTHLASLEAEVRGSRWDDSERTALLLEGRPGKRLSAVDFALIGDRPPLPADRSIEWLKRHLERLLMPDIHCDARQEYMECIGPDDLDDLASDLAELDDSAPEIVTELLQLDLARARALFDRRGSDRDPDIDGVFVDMAKVRIAFVLRQIAEEAGDRLHHPFRWDPLDGADGGNTARLGFGDAKLRKELARTEYVLGLYRQGRRSSPMELPGFTTVGARVGGISVSLTALNRASSKKEARLLLNSKERARAEEWLASLRAKHGGRLEDILENEIERIEHQIARLRWQLDAHASVHDGRKRAGNRDPVPPLIGLMTASRYAVAWMLPPPSSFRTKTDSHDHRKAPVTYSGIEVALAWLAEPHNRCPWPVPHKDHASLALRVFTILRYVFVEDDHMLPDELQSVTDPAVARQSG